MNKKTETNYSLGEHDEVVTVLKVFFLGVLLFVGGVSALAYIFQEVL